MDNAVTAGQYLAPDLPERLRIVDCPVVRARRDNPSPERSQVMIWHANYHPDGGQLFFPPFYDEQGKVHARISCNFAQEFGALLAVNLRSFER